MIDEPHYLPIPYPRYLSNLTADGLIKAKGDKKPVFI
jgi:hypothetical protein